MPKNIVICCDGTGNEIAANLSNVLKLFRIVTKDAKQIVFYDPGIGTLGNNDPWSRLKNNAKQVFGLATGYGLDENVLDAYRFLVDAYEDGDTLYMFGFSRGAYTIRVLGGVLRLVGLLQPSQRNLCDYALTAYKQAAEQNEFEIAWRFERVASTRRVPVKFVGVWDTVSSVFVPRADRFYIPSLQELPYTKVNSYVEVFRHAIAIDERRSMFRANRWRDPQFYKPDRFAAGDGTPQDIKQVWFAGVHSDVGGGYPETESGLAKFPLQWMIDEATKHGIQVNRTMYGHLVLGKDRAGKSRDYVAPDCKGPIHNSMNAAWRALEIWPKRVSRREWQKRPSLFGYYLPLSEPRSIAEGERVHYSVFERVDNVPGYKPPNLPPREKIKTEGPGASDNAAPSAQSSRQLEKDSEHR